MGGRIRRHPRAARCQCGHGSRGCQGRHRFRHQAGVRLCRGAAQVHERVSDRAASRRHCRPARAAGQRRGLLCARGTLRAHRVGLHGRGHGQGGGRQDHRGLLGAVSRRADAPLPDVRLRQGRRRRDHDARRRAGDRHHGLWPVQRQACRRDRGPRQQVRGRGQAHPVRQGRHRRVRRTVRGGGDRRRDGRPRHRGERPGRPGRARP